MTFMDLQLAHIYVYFMPRLFPLSDMIRAELRVEELNGEVDGYTSYISHRSQRTESS